MMDTFFKKKLILFMGTSVVLSVGILSESWAINCPAGTQGSDDASKTSKYCGENCCWGIDNDTHTLTITPEAYVNIVLKTAMI